jgi:hypothetical protein
MTHLDLDVRRAVERELYDAGLKSACDRANRRRQPASSIGRPKLGD